MKYLLCLFAFSLLPTGLSAQTYYTCATAPATLSNLATDAVGTNCGTTRAVWDLAGDSVIARNGTSYFTLLASATDSLQSTLILEEGGSMSAIVSKGQKTILIGSQGTLVLKDTFITSSNNIDIVNFGTLIIESTGVLLNQGNINNVINITGNGTALIEGTVSAASFNIGSGGSVELTGTIDANVAVANDGTLVGDGSITGTTDISGSGTINGITSSEFNNQSPIILSSTGFTFNGTGWDATIGSGTKTTATLSNKDNIIINDAISSPFSLTSSSPLEVGALRLTNGAVLNIADTSKLLVSSSISNSGTINLIDNAQLTANPPGTDTTTGSFVITRNFSRSGWHHIGFPLESTASLTVANLSPTGFAISTAQDNTHSIYSWNASTSSWDQMISSSTLEGKVANIYVSSASSSLSLSIPSTKFNRDARSLSYDYNNPGSSNPGGASGWASGATDGWNHWINPFSAFIDWESFENLPADFNDAIYVWNGVSYISFVNGSGNDSARYVSPGQAFFVRKTSAGSGNYTLAKSVINTSPSTASNHFKTKPSQIVLKLSGQGYNLNTYIVEKFSATKSFDGAHDAFYFAGFSNAPVYNNVGDDSVAYSIQSVPDFDDVNPHISFSYFEDGKPFSIALDKDASSSLNHLYLEDLYSGKITDLNASAYRFTSESSAPVQRFRLLLSSSDISLAELEGHKLVKAWFNNGQLEVRNMELSKLMEIRVYDLQGRLIDSDAKAEGIYVEKLGVYLIKLIQKDGHAINMKLNRS